MLLGDATMATVKTNNQLIAIKANKDYRVQIGDIVDVSIPLNKCHLFDINSGITFQKEVG